MTINMQEADRDFDRAQRAIRDAEAKLSSLRLKHAATARLLSEAEAYAARAADDPQSFARRYSQTDAPRAGLEALRLAIQEAENELVAAKEAVIEPHRAAMSAYYAQRALLAERCATLISEVMPAIAAVGAFRSEMALILSEADGLAGQISELHRHGRYNDESGAGYAAIGRARELLNAVPLELSTIADRKLRQAINAAGNVS